MTAHRKYVRNQRTGYVIKVEPNPSFVSEKMEPVVVVAPDDDEEIKEITMLLVKKFDAHETFYSTDDLARWLSEALREYRDPPPKRQVYTHAVQYTQGGVRHALCGKTWIPDRDGTESVGKCPDCAIDLDSKATYAAEKARAGYPWDY